MVNIFIVHYKKLIDRKKYLQEKLKNYNIYFIDEYDREFVDKYDKIYFKNKNLWKERVDGIYKDDIKYRDLKNSEVCNYLSHLKAYKKILENNLEYAIILEDDVIINDDFDINLNDLINNIPKDYDCIFFGSSFKIKDLDYMTFETSTFVSDFLYKKELGTSRTADAYIVSNKAAKKLVDNINEIALPIDFSLTYFFRHLNMNIYWREPGFISQGSMIGKYRSSLR